MTFYWGTLRNLLDLIDSVLKMILDFGFCTRFSSECGKENLEDHSFMAVVSHAVLTLNICSLLTALDLNLSGSKRVWAWNLSKLFRNESNQFLTLFLMKKRFFRKLGICLIIINSKSIQTSNTKITRRCF